MVLNKVSLNLLIFSLLWAIASSTFLLVVFVIFIIVINVLLVSPWRDGSLSQKFSSHLSGKDFSLSLEIFFSTSCSELSRQGLSVRVGESFLKIFIFIVAYEHKVSL